MRSTNTIDARLRLTACAEPLQTSIPYGSKSATRVTVEVSLHARSGALTVRPPAIPRVEFWLRFSLTQSKAPPIKAGLCTNHPLTSIPVLRKAMASCYRQCTKYRANTPCSVARKASQDGIRSRIKKPSPASRDQRLPACSPGGGLQKEDL